MDSNEISFGLWSGLESWAVLDEPFERLKTKNCIFIDGVESNSVDDLIIKYLPEIIKYSPFLVNSSSNNYSAMFQKAKDALNETSNIPVIFGEMNVHDIYFTIYSLSKEYVIFESKDSNGPYFIFNRYPSD